MELTQAHQELDSNLPKDLRRTADYFGVSRSSEVTGTSEMSQAPQTEDSTMSGTATPVQTLTNDQVVTAARAEVARIFEAKDSQVQVAASIEKYMKEAQQATATATAVQTDLTAAKAKVAELEGQLATARKTGAATQENPTIEGADKDAKEWHKEKDAAYASLNSKVTALEAALAAEKKKGAAFEFGKKKDDRDKKLKDKGVKSDKFKARATASNEDGSLKMSDEDFESALAEFVEQIGEVAVAGDGGGMPIAAPADKEGPAGKQKAPSLTGKGKNGATPVPAPADKTGPAAQQRTAKMAHASEGAAAEVPAEGEVAAVEGEEVAVETETQATAAAVPAAPDLSAAESYQQATAAVLAQSGPAPTAKGKTSYAKAFGI